MSLDFSTLFFLLFVVMTRQAQLMGRWHSVQRGQAIRAIEKAHGTRVITMIHRQEKRSLCKGLVQRSIEKGGIERVWSAT
jgi:hypothetical protein